LLLVLLVGYLISSVVLGTTKFAASDLIHTWHS
jgi:hypothetical protein